MTIEPNSVAIAGVMVGWAMVAVAMVVGQHPSRGARVRYRNVAGLVGLVLQGAAFALAFGWHRSRLDSSMLGWGVAAVSVALAASSSGFLLAAVRTLGKQWSLLPRLVEQHTLVEAGPYSVVRHPIYLAMLGMLLSTGLAFGPSLAVLVALALYILGTIPRIRMEERLLNQTFGKQYARYSRHVPAFLPLRWHRKTA
ncbi:isoprenylcysteine carboxylmethyltransferase family protein [Dyella sp.]|uniref:methyltransferase family protein n=1 Tax=Dyella sp. TaxID=1869338 RepID=UPI002D76721B|nr:isoprenylcysteine carboxylmethyltransferase family protein [Dyella sp.]HET7332239.1 isoprenylcysteine carboxylmethyltransferase family protein [Dyella sp.]